MTEVTSDEKPAVDLDAVPPPVLRDASNDELVRQLAERARAEGLQLTGEAGFVGPVDQTGGRVGARR